MMSPHKFLIVSTTSILALLCIVCSLSGLELLPDGPVSMMAEVTRSLAKGEGLLPNSFKEQVGVAQQLSRETNSSVWQDIVSMNSQGEYLPKHSILSSLMAVPFYLVFKDFGFLLLQQIFVLALVLSLYKLSSLVFGATYPWSILLGCFVFSQTTFYVYSFSHDLHGSVLLLLGLTMMQIRGNASVVIGVIIMSLSVVIRPSYLILVLALALFGRLIDSKPRLIHSMLGLSSGLALIGLYNQLVYGNPIANGYTFVPAFERGQQILSHHPIGFSWDVLRQDWGRKIFGINGLIPTNLGFIFAPLVARFCWNHRSKVFLAKLFGVSLLYMGYIFSYQMWDVSAVGNRFLFPSIYLYLIALIGYLGQFEALLKERLIRVNLDDKS